MSPTVKNKSTDLTDTAITITVTSKVMVTNKSQATVINNHTVTVMVNKLMDPAMVTNNRTVKDMDISKLMVTVMDMATNLMDPVMVINNPTVTDTVNLAMVMDTTEVITTKDTDTSMTTSISTIPTKRSDTMPKSKMTIATKS